MKRDKMAWRWQGQKIIPLFLAVLLFSCAPQAIETPVSNVADNSSQVQHLSTFSSGQITEIIAGTRSENFSQTQGIPTLQTGFEISMARYPQPLGTDLWVNPSPDPWGDYAFSHIPGGGIPYTKPFDITQVNLGSGPTAPSVCYRSRIDTIAGEVHCNRLVVCERDPTNLCQAAFSQCDLRLTNKFDKIQFYLTNGGWSGAGPCAVCDQPILVIDVAQDIKPGVYTTGILVFLDSKYLTTLHCAIDVGQQ